MNLTPEQFNALELWIMAAAAKAVSPYYGPHDIYDLYVRRREEARALLVEAYRGGEG